MKQVSFKLANLLLLAVSAATFASSLSGCGWEKPKAASSGHVVDGAYGYDSSGGAVSTQAQVFAPANITFKYSQLFMWKKDTTPNDVAGVFNNTTLLEDTQDQIFLLKRSAKPIKAKFDAIGVDLQNYPHQLEVELPSKQSQLTKAQSQLDDLKKQPPTDDLNQQITKLQAKIVKLTDQIAPILKEQSAIKVAKLEGDLEEWKSLDATITQKQADADSYLVPINDAVWIFNSSPILFDFSFDVDSRGGIPVAADGTVSGVHANVHNWDLSQVNDPEVVETGVNVDFSTESFRAGRATMGQVSYDTLGGVFTFEVYTPAATYWYKIARTKYAAIDKRVHYKGDIVRCSVEGGSGRPVIVHVRDFVQCGVESGNGTPALRRGAANLVDLDDNS